MITPIRRFFALRAANQALKVLKAHRLYQALRAANQALKAHRHDDQGPTSVGPRN